MDAKFMFMAASLSASFFIAASANANKAIAYEPIVACEANYRQAPYGMKCWSEKLGKETTIGDFIEAIRSGEVPR